LTEAQASELPALQTLMNGPEKDKLAFVLREIED
jgi:hypothetical protein